MLITDKSDEKRGSGVCFTCGLAIEKCPYIFIEGGNEAEVSLHPMCAIKLMQSIVASLPINTPLVRGG